MFIKNFSYGVDHLPSSVSDAGGFLQFYSFIHDELLSFEAFLTSYSDSFNSSWNSETVFGRVDPIQTFQNTQRTMGLSFTVPNVVSRKDTRLSAGLYDIIVSNWKLEKEEEGNGRLGNIPKYFHRDFDPGPYCNETTAFDWHIDDAVHII